MTYAEQAARIAIRRSRNYLRERRRQAELERMATRLDSTPIYRDKFGRDGERIASTYLGHVVIFAA